MSRPSLAELERRCQKPDHQRIGNWMARRISRPAALRVTWVIAPWGVTANMATLGAWASALAAAAAMAYGGPWGWACGAVLMQVWYLLDHVDGQLARLHRTSSLDGIQLDYLMHHTVNLLLPLAIGYGLAMRQENHAWLLCGLAWGVGLLLLGLQHDARYKAFVVRLKRLRGELIVRGGGGGVPLPQTPIPHQPLRLASWLLQKACEMHVMMNLISALALLAVLVDRHLCLARAYTAVMGPLALLVAVATLVRAQRNAAAEREFTDWYRTPAEHVIAYREGWWIVGPAEDSVDGVAGGSGESGECGLLPFASDKANF